MTDEKTEEAQVRRAASRIAWRIEKSRARNLHADDQGLYRLVNGNIVAGGDRYDATLDDCAYWIEEERVRRVA